MSAPGTALLVDMTFEIGAKVFECALHRLCGARSQGAECVSGVPHPGERCELVEVAGLPATVFHRLQNPLRPSEPAPAGRAEPAGLLRKKVCQVPGHADGTGFIIEHDHGAGAHT